MFVISKLNDKGDTIVEVLLAIAIVGVVLGGAFVAANRSLNIAQQSQDRSQATKILEAQLERLKSIASDRSKDIFNPASSSVFCMDNVLNRQNFSVGSLPAVAADNLTAAPGGNYPAACIVDSASNPYSGASQSIEYYVSIQRDAVDSNKFTVRARWFRAGGGIADNGREEASMAYRLYQ